MVEIVGIPEIELPEFLQSFEDFFDPFRLTFPNQATLSTTSTTHEEFKDDIWYINIATSDDIFEYRVVELPFGLVADLPRRNLTESEWRSIGVTQSKGWENYFRPFGEKHVLLFRRPRDGVERRIMLGRIQMELEASVDSLENLPDVVPQGVIEQLRNGFNFPMTVFDAGVGEWADLMEECQIPFASIRRLLEFQVKVLKFSIQEILAK